MEITEEQRLKALPDTLVTHTIESLHQKLIFEQVMIMLPVSQTLIDNYSSTIIISELIEEKHESARKTLNLIDGLAQPNREQLMYRTGCIDGGLLGEMAELRQKRNLIVHNSEIPEIIDNPVEVAEQCVRVLEVLEDMAEDESFTYR